MLSRSNPLLAAWHKGCTERSMDYLGFPADAESVTSQAEPAVPEYGMFRYMRNSSEYGTLDLVERFMQALRTVVPLGTLNRMHYETSADRAWDALIRWDTGASALLLGINVKIGSVRTLPKLPVPTDSTVTPVLISTFLSKAVRRELENQGWSYWDVTGNTLIRSESPFVAVRLEGQGRDPDPEPQPATKLRSLKGRAASEVIVGLLQNGGRASTIRDFARDHRLPLGTVSRVVSLLREENLLEPNGGGPIVLTDRLEVARRWADDYSFAKSFRARRYFSLNGPELALSKIAGSGMPYAITGVRAAQNWLEGTGQAAGLPPTETWVYVSDRAAVERMADLAADAREGQIVVAECDFLGRERARRSGVFDYVTPWRIVGDLLSAGGRMAGVGEQVAGDLIRRWA